MRDVMGYVVEESYVRVGDGKPYLRTLFRWRAVRRRDRMNAMRAIPSCRWEIVKNGRHYEVIAFQNYARPV